MNAEENDTNFELLEEEQELTEEEKEAIQKKIDESFLGFGVSK